MLASLGSFVQILVGGVMQGAIFALVALGFSLVHRVTGVINLSQGAFCVVGALVVYTMQVQWGWPAAAAVLGAVFATAGGGAVLGAAAFVPGLSRLSNSNMLMLTAGLLTLLEGLVLVVWGSQPYALPAFSGERPLAVGGVLVPSQGPWVLGALLLTIAGLWWLLARTGFGHALRACAENPQAARLMGIGVPGMMLFSFTLAAGLGALGGIVIAPATSLQFDTGRLFTVSGFIAVAIGGIGSLPGAVAGGLLLGIAQQMATAYVSSLFSSALALGLLLAVLVVRPGGLLGAGAARREDVRTEARVTSHAARLPPRAAMAGGALLLAVGVAVPAVVPDGEVLAALVIALILFVALIGLDVLMGYAGQVSLGQGGFMALGGYTAAWLAVTYDVPPAAGLLAGMALAAACALLLSVVTLRLRGLYLALGTLAFGLLIESCVVGFDGITGGPSGLVGIPALSVAGFEFDTPGRMFLLASGVAAVLAGLVSGVIASPYGRAMQAVRTDQLAAAALGIPVVRVKLAAFTFSAATAALAGGLLAFHIRFLSPEMVGTPRSFELVSMMVVGGEGTVAGPLLGALLITLLPALSASLAAYKTLAVGLLLVVFFLRLPEGLFGLLARAVPGRRA